MARCYYIYKTTNFVDGRIYVGQHFGSTKDGYLGSSWSLKQDITKHGRKNFKKEVLVIGNAANIDQLERDWIEKLDARNPKVGYNITSGGTGGIKEISEELREVQRQRMLGSNNPMYGQTHTKEAREKISDAKKQLVGEKSPRWGQPGFGKGQTYEEMYGSEKAIEQKQKISQALKGKPKPWRQGVSLSRKTRDKISKVKSQRFPYKMVAPSGEEKIIYGLKQFCKDHDLSHGCMLLVSKGNQQQHKGWTCERLF